MKIPRQFELFGQTIKVQEKPPQYFRLGGQYGEYCHEDGIIRINSGCPERLKLHTFWHEYFHAALEELGYHNESAKEDMVDGLAGLTVQMLKTAQK